MPSTTVRLTTSKHTLDAGFGQFLSILKFLCWKRGVYFDKVDKNYTSQVCPQCDAHTGKKELKDRVHSCPECGYTTHRDVAAAQIVRNRGSLPTLKLSLPTLKLSLATFKLL